VEQHVALIRLVDRLAVGLNRDRLVHADPRGNARLTSSGLDLLPSARGFLAAAEALSETRIIVRLSTYPSIASQLVARSPELFDGTSPVELHEVGEDARQGRGRGLVRDVEAGTLDLAIAPAGLSTAAVEEQPLYRWSLRALLPSSRCRASRGTITPDQLNDFRIAAAPTGHTSRDLLDAVYASENLDLIVSLESSSQELLRALVASSATYAAVIPDDAYGTPDPRLGPRLVTRLQKEWGGRYSLYVRTGSATSRGARDSRDSSALVAVMSAVTGALSAPR
jgi:hypothetical protein